MQKGAEIILTHMIFDDMGLFIPNTFRMVASIAWKPILYAADDGVSLAEVKVDLGVKMEGHR